MIHNDLHASNLVLADSLYLLDWEYAAVSDPLIDIACILAYYPQAEPHVPLLLAESGVAELGATSADLLWLTQWHLLIDCLWHRLRRAQGVSAPGEVDREQSFLRRLRLVRCLDARRTKIDHRAATLRHNPHSRNSRGGISAVS